MRVTRMALRIWIASTSLAGFLGGWILLAHAPKPAPLVAPLAASSEVSLPPLPDLPPLDGGAIQLQQLPSFQQSFNAFSRLRTRGS